MPYKNKHKSDLKIQLFVVRVHPAEKSMDDEMEDEPIVPVKGAGVYLETEGSTAESQLTNMEDIRGAYLSIAHLSTHM